KFTVNSRWQLPRTFRMPFSSPRMSAAGLNCSTETYHSVDSVDDVASTAPFNAVALTPDAISFAPRSPATSWKSRALLNPFTRSLLVEDRQQRASHGIGRSASTCSFHRLTTETPDRGLLAALVIRNH